MKWIVEPRDVEVAVGKQLHIPCVADGLPKPSIEWTRIGADNKPEIFGPELRFGSVGQQDAGMYECRARNGVEKDLISRTKLNVLGK